MENTPKDRQKKEGRYKSGGRPCKQGQRPDDTKTDTQTDGDVKGRSQTDRKTDRKEVKWSKETTKH